VANWPIPKTIKKIRSLFGFADYYRKFIARFASIVSPINDLFVATTGNYIKQKSKFKWEIGSTGGVITKTNA